VRKCSNGLFASRGAGEAIQMAARPGITQNDPMVSLPPPLLPEYKDRRAGLTIFGVLTLLLGVFAACSVPLMGVGLVAGSRPAGPTLSWGQVVTSAVQMAVYATALIWLGIGSLKARRWARALMLCGGWIGLVFGVISCALLPWVLDSVRVAMEQQPGMERLPAGFVSIVSIVTMVIMGFFYLVVPLSVVLFYRSRHVKLTCEARDPVERWTDRCPLPVLAAVLVLGYAAFVILTVLPQYGGAFLLFGTIVTGAPAVVAWVVVVGALIGVTVGIYRLDRRAWFGGLAVVAFLGVSALISFGRISLLDYYRAIGLSEEQLAMVANMPMVRSGAMGRMMLPSLVVALGYLVYLHRFFRRKPDAAAG